MFCNNQQYLSGDEKQDKQPIYYIEALKNASLNTVKNNNIANIVNIVTRNLSGTSKNQVSFKEILISLGVQLNSGCERYFLFEFCYI